MSEDVTADYAPVHWHRFGAFHRHPGWHGHCDVVRFTEPDGPMFGSVHHYKHSCRRWHFHLPFKHRHAETGR